MQAATRSTTPEKLKEFVPILALQRRVVGSVDLPAGGFLAFLPPTPALLLQLGNYIMHMVLFIRHKQMTRVWV